ncbi:hypothetical protein AVEN_185277-1, partial [Araneus ventricosus]
MLSFCYYFRVLSHENHTLREAFLDLNMARLFNNRPSCIPPLGLRIRKLLPNDFQTIAIYNSNLFGTPPWIVDNFSFLNPFKNLLKSETCSDIFRSIFYSHRHHFSDYLPIYTDGSKSTTAAGCAFVCQNDIVSRRLHLFSSIFTSELTAIYMALEYLSNKQPIKAIIYTDSFSVLQPLRGTSSLDVTGFTTPRYPSVCSPFEFCLLFEFHLSFTLILLEGAIRTAFLRR